MYKPLVLIVLDGWGISNSIQGNPIREATLPTFEKLNRFYPMTTLQASGISVGLPWNTAGNSEVGHMTMGAGRVIYQNMPRISLSIQDGSFFKNEVLLDTINTVKKNKSKLHLMGLISSGSVHSHRDHLLALLRLVKNEGLSEVYVHVFTDGRDSAPTAGIQQVKELTREMRLVGIGKIASLSGRNFSMDRNNNWDRIEKTYRMLTEGSEKTATDPLIALEQSYIKNITDEYIEPTVITEKDKPIALIKNKDAVIFFNFREDRARELTKAFTVPDFDGFQRKLLDIHFTTFTEHERGLPAHIAFPPEDVEHSLGETLSLRSKKQLRIAETEKYAHVTYFFNGGKEKAFPGEDRLLIPSPTVSHFDEIPEMSSPQITEALIAAVEKNEYDFILVNYANPDMVGHTGNEEASIKAVEATDKSLSIVVPAVLKAGGAMIITADHGNVEELKKASTGEADTEHSTNPIPLWYITPENHREKAAEQMMREQNEVNGLLSDIAPTVLDIMGIEKPAEMNGASLLPTLK
ncbi:MAG: phosphoglycerate mutase (2,3-diphosphoglycerate-independent) [Candidatus Moranbacteria bacterium RIFCSPLOWO2_02_FULL_48_19]|nr:MAG: phosphoglycerate mutase (2,3-diphosphoglycerate-independent) [Candidatus Moranbacteria bacterium RIFCSPLOWO2_02_FULL_48_19]OGI31621.1 MAG: phosphoglycerate mutase (2,3-diphosphoglycerate-independent) [Candidatus Moranbacteria bacterium RIFCSPLOWO2_12_FULL_48_12]